MIDEAVELYNGTQTTNVPCGVKETRKKLKEWRKLDGYIHSEEARLKKLAQELDELDCVISSAKYGVVGKSGKISDVSGDLAEIERMREKIITEIDYSTKVIKRLNDNKRRIDEAVYMLLEQEETRIIRYKYYDGLSWEAIGFREHMSSRSCQRIEKNAVERIINVI
ncbi:hypothetical protein FACS18948_6490 [Clostridia bacterium]|nr:hypothetical protein FACS18948_6490 [Clostridia bacterium]